VKPIRVEPEGAAVKRSNRLFTKNTGLC